MKDYNYLLGKTKKEIIQEMGDEYNHYPSEIWTYLLKRNWLRRRKMLILYFENNVVKNIKVCHTW
jgi:hypothetical protein